MYPSECGAKMASMSMLGMLRSWIGLVGLTALIAGSRSLWQSDSAGVSMMKERLYVHAPALSTELSSRTWGAWVLLAAFVRVYGSIYFDCKP